MARTTEPASGAHAPNPAAAKALIGEVHRLLTSVGNQVLPSSSSGRYYGTIDAMQTPFFLDRDEKGRSRYACNYELLVRGSTGYDVV